MSDLEGLYQNLFSTTARNRAIFILWRMLDRHADGYNPLCGDRFTVYLKLKDDRIVDISFQGAGCAISTASASILTEILKGKTRAQAEAIFEQFRDLVTGKTHANGETPALGKLAAFSGVSRVSRPGEVRDPCLAHAPERARRRRGSRLHRATPMNEQAPLTESEIAALQEKLIEALRTCYDPEIPVNIYYWA